MTDRISAFIVTLDHDMREDDADSVRRAISMVRHVLSVSAVVSDVAQQIADERAREYWRKKFIGDLG